MQRAWDAQWLTNNGPLLKEFEAGLNAYLGTKDCAVVSNGTIAIQVALQALGIKGEVITTPFLCGDDFNHSLGRLHSCICGYRCKDVQYDPFKLNLPSQKRLPLFWQRMFWGSMT